MPKKKAEKDKKYLPTDPYSTSVNVQYGYFKAFNMRRVLEDMTLGEGFEAALAAWAGESFVKQAFVHRPTGEERKDAETTNENPIDKKHVSGGRRKR